MAAVAGTISDLIADSVVDAGATRITVNNGGDISIRSREEAEVEVGLCSDLARRQVDYVVPVKGNCGVCTSGMGGRSFTLGVANSVTVLASRASVADVFATYLGNETVVDSPKVQKDWAERVYPDTDIPGRQITVSVGNLSDSEVRQALINGQTRAQWLIDRGLIYGAILSVKGHVLPLGVLEHRIKELKQR